MSTVLRASLRLSVGLGLVVSLVACGGSGAAVAPPRTPPSPECPAPPAATVDPRVLALLGHTSTSLTRGDHGSAIAFLRAAASLGPSPLDDAATRAALERLSLPVVVTPSTRVHERSADGSVVAFIAPPAPLTATSALSTLCDDTPLEWANLAQGTQGSMRLTQLAGSEQLAPVLALDAQAAAEGQMVHSLQLDDYCGPTVDLCGHEPHTSEVQYLAGHAAPSLVPRHALCGRVEALSPHGQFAIVALPQVGQGRLGQGLCRPPGRFAWSTDPAHLVCMATRYVVLSLVDQRVALEAAHTTDAIRFSEDERYAYVRAGDSAVLAPLAPGLTGVTLAADCRTAVAFAPNGESFVAVCGQRLDIVSLGATVSTRSVPLDRRGLAPFGDETVVAVATTSAVDQFALVFAPGRDQRRHVQHRWAVLDARGRVTDRVHEAASTPARAATSVSPVLGQRTTAPVIRHGGSALCGGLGLPYHGQTLAQTTGAGARFVTDTLLVWGRSSPVEAWSRRPTRVVGRNARWTFVETWRASDAGELLWVEPVEQSGWRLVFAERSYDEYGDTMGERAVDHALGPTRWDARNTDDDHDTEIEPDLATFLRSTGTRTNLRVCPDDLRVVAVLPHPAPDTVWADTEACTRSTAISSDGEWECRAGQL